MRGHNKQSPEEEPDIRAIIKAKPISAISSSTWDNGLVPLRDTVQASPKLQPIFSKPKGKRFLLLVLDWEGKMISVLGRKVAEA